MVGRLFIVKADVNGDSGVLKDSLVRQALRAGYSILGDPGFGRLGITLSLDAQYLSSKCFQGLPGLVLVDAVTTGSIPDDGLPLKQVVIDEDIGDTRWVGGAETGGTNRVGDESGEHIFLLEKG